MNPTRKQIMLLGASFFALILGGVVLFATFKLRPKETPTPKEEAGVPRSSAKFLTQNLDEIQDVAIAKVGREELYGKDLKKMLEYYFHKYLEEEPVPSSIKEEALEKAVEKSIILQEAGKNGWITLDKTAFNSPNKDFRTRNSLLETAEEKIITTMLRLTEGRYISVWFYNMEPPTMGVEKARKIAREKIEALHPKLISEELGFEEAAWQLYQDPEVAQITEPRTTIDVIPAELTETGSCYGKFYLGGNKQEGVAFFEENQEMEEKVRKLKEGEISEILSGKDGNYYEGQGFYDAFFVIYTVDGIKNPRSQETLDELLAQKKKEYKIAYY